MTGTTAIGAPDSNAAKLEPAGNKNNRDGSSSEKAEALAEARDSKKRVEVKSEQTATDSLFANPDGTFSHEKTSAPIRAKGADGKLAPIDTDLAQKDGRLEPKVATGDVSFSADGKGEGAKFNLSKDSSVGLTFKGELGAPEVKGRAATYTVKTPATKPAAEETPAAEQSAEAEPDAAAEKPAAAGEKVQMSAGPDGFNAHVILSEAPKTAPTYTFILNLDGLTATLKDNVLELSDAGGKVVAESRPLTMWDAARDEAGDPSNTAAVDAKLVQGEKGTAELVLTPSLKYLDDPKTKYPVTVDPDIATVEDRGDTYYFNGQATTDSRGSDYRLRTGYQDGATHRSLVTFGYQDYVGQTVTSATLKMYQYSSATCTAKTSNAFPVVADVAGTITWATRPTIEDSNRFKTSKSFNHGQGSCPDAYEDLDVTPMVSAWAGGTLDGDTAGNERQGIELRASSENDSSHDKRFCSNNAASSGNCDDPEFYPVLSVTYAPELGNQSSYSMTSHKLNGSSELAINNRSGNALVTANDASVNARGLAFGVTRSYNSQSQFTTSMAKGWNLGVGPDVWLEKKSQYRYDYHAPDGTVFGSFVRKTSDTGSSVYDNFISPLGGVGAELDEDADAFRLTFNDSQLTYEFKVIGSNGHAYLSKAVDRSGNEMTYGYSGTTTQLSTITDAGGRTYAVTYTGGYITKISENGGLDRNWTYGYSGDYLTEYTDPDGKKTNYAYATGFDGPELLETITNPANQTAARPTTTLDYGHDGALNVDQVVQVSYVLNGTTNYVYTWDYFDTENDTPECDDHGDFSTRVFDPNAARTTYCYKPRDEAGGEMKTWVYDGEGNKRDEDFNIDRQTQTLTSGASGSTVATYAASRPDQIQTVTDPKSSGSTSGERTNIDYDHDPGSGSSSPKGEDYLPASVTDPNGDCIRYEYDSLGRMTEANTQLRGSGTDRSCADDTSGGVASKFEYNTDGTLAKSADANAGSSPPDADKTIYTYWTTADSGYIVGSVGLIKSVRKPGGDCATATRKLCKSYTYDDAGRTKTVTDGNGIKTTMEYDKLDRTTEVLFNGTTTCVTATCNTYEYDAEGNLTKRKEAAGDTTFTYDRMNRQLTTTQPGSIVMTMSYDGVGNLTGYTQDMPGAVNPDGVAYVYDKANMVTGVTDSAGTIVVTPDDDGHTEKIKFPGSGGILLDYDFKDNEKPEEATVTNQAGTKLLEFDYDYTQDSDDEDQLQSRVTSGIESDLNGTISYEYGDGRLDAASDSSTAGRSYTYEHDNVNNVTKETKTSTSTYFGYDRAGQLCWRGATSGTKLGTSCPATPSGNTTLTQDAAGNNLNTTANATTYNNQNQVTNLDGIAMDYLDLGNDKRTTAGSATLVDGPLGITARKVGTDITWYTRMPDGTILNSRKGGTTQNYFTEPQSKSVAALYSPSGDRTATYVYSPYGETTVESGGSGGPGDDNPFRYISGFQDTGDGQNYYKLGARYYDGRGHFTQPDPIPGNATDPKTMTAYNYAAGDPVNNSDPDGLAIRPGPIVTNSLNVFNLYQNCLKEPVDAIECQATQWAITYGVVFGGGCMFLAKVPTAAPACFVVGVAGGQVGYHSYKVGVALADWLF